MIKYILLILTLAIAYSCNPPTYPRIKPIEYKIIDIDTIDYMLEGEFQDDTIGQTI